MTDYIGVIGSSVARQQSCTVPLAACDYFQAWSDPTMEIIEGKYPEIDGVPLREPPKWLDNTIAELWRLMTIAERALRITSVITFS